MSAGGKQVVNLVVCGALTSAAPSPPKARSASTAPGLSTSETTKTTRMPSPCPATPLACAWGEPGVPAPDTHIRSQDEIDCLLELLVSRRQPDVNDILHLSGTRSNISKVFMKSAILLLLSAAVVCADDGLWLFNQFPSDAVKQKYEFDVDSGLSRSSPPSRP